MSLPIARSDQFWHVNIPAGFVPRQSWDARAAVVMYSLTHAKQLLHCNW